MNVLGERLRDEERHRDAIAIFELNLEHFAGSLSILFELGALYEAIEDVEGAIRLLRARARGLS
jgi:tetratricopeptide (TPR) repeat protein